MLKKEINGIIFRYGYIPEEKTWKAQVIGSKGNIGYKDDVAFTPQFKSDSEEELLEKLEKVSSIIDRETDKDFCIGVDIPGDRVKYAVAQFFKENDGKQYLDATDIEGDFIDYFYTEEREYFQDAQMYVIDKIYQYAPEINKFEFRMDLEDLGILSTYISNQEEILNLGVKCDIILEAEEEWNYDYGAIGELAECLRQDEVNESEWYFQPENNFLMKICEKMVEKEPKKTMRDALNTMSYDLLNYYGITGNVTCLSESTVSDLLKLWFLKDYTYDLWIGCCVIFNPDTGDISTPLSHPRARMPITKKNVYGINIYGGGKTPLLQMGGDYCVQQALPIDFINYE